MLTYNKTIWSKGIVVSMDRLNNIENGISNCVNAINNLSNRASLSDSDLGSINNTIDKKIAAHNISIESHNNKFNLKADKTHRHNFGSKISDLEDRLSVLEEKINLILSKYENQDSNVKEETETENAE